MAFQNKANPSLAISSTKTFFLKSSLFPAPKKQPNSLWVNLSSKLASNSKLTSNKYKKYIKTPKNYGALATTSEKPLEK